MATATLAPVTSKNIVFVDSVDNLKNVTHRIKLHIKSSDIQAYVLDKNSLLNMLEQIQQILVESIDLNSINIINHGVTGTTLFDKKLILNQHNTINYQALLDGISNHLTSSGDILIWDYDWASGNTGNLRCKKLADYIGSPATAKTYLRGLPSRVSNAPNRVNKWTIVIW